MKNCPQCRSQITDDDAKICPYCGANIEFVRPKTKYDRFDEGKRNSQTASAIASAMRSESFSRDEQPKQPVGSSTGGINESDFPTPLVVFLGFIFPMFGFILYFVLKPNHPRIAKDFARGAWTSTVIIFIIMSLFRCITYMYIR